MEKYQIEKKIGQGFLATVYKVTNKENNKQNLVLKEVECQDFTKALIALDEFRVFHNLEHRYITRLYDSCIKWDRKTSNAYICYIMDYYDKGDLMAYLIDMRSKKAQIPYKVLRIWMAELVDGVNFLHQYGLIHRNLKPSSLYFKLNQNSKDSELMIGDFGVYTVMKDARTKTRIIPGAFNYAAPEIIDSQEFDTKSDIWTIGTILLDMCTTSLYDQKQIQSILLNIRHDDYLLNQVLNDIYKVYDSKDLIKVLQKTLEKNKNHRINMKSLMNEDFVFDGLNQINSDVVRNLGSNNTKTIPNHPELNNCDAIMSFIKSNIENEQEIQSAIVLLIDLANKIEYNLLANLDNQKILAKLMKNYSNNVLIQISILNLFERSLLIQLTKTRSNKLIEENQRQNQDHVQKQIEKLNLESYLNPNLVENFFYIFLKHEFVEDVQLHSLKLIIQLSNYEDVSDHLASFDVIRHLSESFKVFHSNAILSGYICKAIWCLSIHDSVFKSLFKYEFLKDVRNVLIKFRKDKFCVEMACNVVLTLCMNERLIEREEMEVDSTSAVLIGLKHHLDSSSVTKSALMALTSLIGFSEECAFRFLYLPAIDDLETEIAGIKLLNDVYFKHKDESEIVQLICDLLKELSKYDEMIVEFKSLKLNETLLSDISRRFKDNIQISQTCVFISLKIQNKKNSQAKKESTSHDDAFTNKVATFV